MTNDLRPGRWTDADVKALEDLSDLDGQALPWSDWAMRPAAISQLVAEVTAGRRHVLELGAGVSTVFLARAVREHGGRLVSIEHDPGWAQEIEALLEKEGLDRAEVVTVPLTPPTDWYDVEEVRRVCGDSIDLLVVDGPPAGHTPDVLVRAPAVPALADLLSPAFTIVLDDIARAPERRTAELWREMLNCDLALDEQAEIAMLRSDPRQETGPRVP